MTCKKPETESIEVKAQKILEYMKQNRRFVTKDELQEVIGCGERIVRDCINYLRNHNKMIVSVSSQKGYKYITKADATKQDIEWVKLMWMELDSRIEELENVRAICIRCWEYHQQKEREQFQKQVQAIKENENDEQRINATNQDDKNQ